jgi:hypothetical protein
MTHPLRGAMKRLTSLWRELALECASWCGTSAELDIRTVELRVKSEGDSFLTISLPRFGKAVFTAIDAGYLDYASFAGFQRRGGLPVFLRGFLSQIFDPSGVMLEEPSIESIRSVRQLTLAFGKIQRLCSNARIADAMQKFVEIEQELEAFDPSSLEESIFPAFLQASTLLWGDVFSHVENSLLGTHHLAQQWVSSNDTEESHKHARKGTPAKSRLESVTDPMDVILGLPGKGVVQSVFTGRSTTRFQELEELGDCKIVDPTSFYTLIPRHGPGATADRLRGNAKFTIGEWPLRLENVFPYGDYALPQLADENELDCVKFLEPGAEVAVQVTPVPKTDEAPRIIAVEPTAMQYMQQALCYQVVNRLEHSFEFQPPLGGKEFDLGKFFIGFADQEANRFLAREGSLNGGLATLDLSEASDRVLNSHVLLLLSRFPRLSEAVQATRSTHADVQGHGVIPLAKFASMGSALCFPIEAMVFVTIIFTAIAAQRRSPVNRKLLLELRGKVRVYGDDIIVPVEYVHCVTQYLEAFGLRVNYGKSFWNGKFRESCGGDYYDGEWVTPVRLRHDLPQSLHDVEGVVGLASFRNLLYWEGYWNTARAIDDYLSVLLKGRWKVVDRTAAGLGRESIFPYRWEYLSPTSKNADGSSTRLYEPRIAGATVWRKIPESPTSGSGALLKFLIKRGILPSQDEKHLERQGRPVESRIKLQGIRPY